MRTPTLSLVEIGGVDVYLATPNEIPEAHTDKAAMAMHGGALVFGGGREVAVDAVRGGS